jgi:hypothetical protein
VIDGRSRAGSSHETVLRAREQAGVVVVVDDALLLGVDLGISCDLDGSLGPSSTASVAASPMGEGPIPRTLATSV